MDIYNLLPSELQNKVKYYVLEHPTAKIIKEEIERLRCDEYYVFRDKEGKVFCKVDGRDFLASECFRQFNKKKDDTDSDTSDEDLDEICERVFSVSSATSSDDGG